MARHTFKSMVALLAALVVSASYAQSDLKPLDTAAKRLILDKVTSTLKENAFVPGADFGKLDALIDEERSAIDAATDEKGFTLAVNEALSKLGYSHVVLISPKAVEARKNHQSVGIGIQIAKEDTGIRIMAVFPDSGAAEAGLMAGDLIVEFEGKKADDPAALVGPEGTVMKIKVQKQSGVTKDYAIVRKKYSNVRPETLEWTGKDAAVIKIPTFDLGYDRDRVESLFKEAASAKKLVLDLRSNGGGAVMNLIHLMTLVLPTDTAIGSFISKRTVDSYKKETGESTLDLAKIGAWTKFKLRVPKSDLTPFSGKVAVLINGGSGSASEIAAAALQESLNAPVVGTKSAGAVLVSVLSQLPEGFLLQYPITDYVTAKGVRLEGHGVIPVAETPAAVKFGDPDLALARAVELLDGAK